MAWYDKIYKKRKGAAEMTTSELGESLKKFRKNYKLSQKEMATNMGVNLTMYQAYEGGKSALSILVLVNLADSKKSFARLSYR